jgi:hypothetical protein
MLNISKRYSIKSNIQLNSTINPILRPHPSLPILNISILNRSQTLKQFQKSRPNLTISKLDLHIPIRNTLDRLPINPVTKGSTVMTAAVPQAATSANVATSGQGTARISTFQPKLLDNSTSDLVVTLFRMEEDSGTTNVVPLESFDKATKLEVLNSSI